METSTIAPWNVKPGMRIAYGYVTAEQKHDFLNRYRILTVVSVTKYTAHFTGKSAWKIAHDNGEVWTYHGKYRSLPVEKVTILTD